MENTHKTALVTGGTGFIGSHLVEALLRDGWKVRCLIRENSSRRFLPHDRIEFSIGSLADRESLKKSLTGISTIFHLAGRIKGKTREDFFQTNHQGTKNLLKAARENGKNLESFILVSSLSAAGPSLDGHLLTEDETPRPISFYGESKLAAEQEAKKFSGDFSITIIRPPAVYGPRDTETLRLIKLSGWGLRFIPGGEKNIYSSVHVTDMVSALLLAARHHRNNFRIYFIGDGKEYHWRETFTILRDNLGKNNLAITLPWKLTLTTIKLLARIFPRSSAGFYLDKIKEINHNYWVCSINRAQNELDFKPEYNLQEGLRDTIRWYRTEGWL
ncbi:MAG: NAD(P)-dependent oxidoreductase [Candidatus Auribacterota bacterium]|nr:NAD(P)-dependent oxidoreductase [Candidatus Auribacterota bacterium]